MSAESFTPPTPPVGIIESLASGFETVASHLWLLTIPLVLDLALWVGPRISFRPAFESYFHDTWLPFVAETDASSREALDGWTQVISEMTDTVPASQYLQVFGIPSLITAREASRLPFPYTPPVLRVQTFSGVFGANAASFLLGLLLWGAYIGLITQQVSQHRIDIGWMFRRIPVILIQIVFLQTLLLIAVFTLSMVFVIGLLALPALGTVALSADSLTGGLPVAILLFFLMIAVWIGLFLSFTVHGMFINNRGLLGAIWDSIRVVQWNLPATVGLFALIMLISVAMRYIWELADPGSWLVLAGIGGNAFIATGLTTTTFVFFKDRYRYWRELREELLAELERRRVKEIDKD